MTLLAPGYTENGVAHIAGRLKANRLKRERLGRYLAESAHQSLL